MNKELTEADVREPYRRRMVVMKFVTHFIVLVIIFILPEVLLSWGRSMPKFVYVHTLGYILVFYLNYYLLIDRFLFKRNRKWLYFVSNLSFVFCYLFIIFGVHCMYPPVSPPGTDAHLMLPEDWYKRGIMNLFSRDFVMMVLSIGTSVALKLSEKWMGWQQREQQMAAEQKEMELKNLKNQLNPHFLFNTLNNIYALIGISPERAQYAVHELSQLLRYVLYDNDKNVPLDKEMLFVKNYIELMRLRLNSNMVTLNVDIQETRGVGLMIAPLLFVSLVENAFKHGVSASSKSLIDISITVNNGIAVCKVVNSYFPKDEGDRSGKGIGLVNLRRQLSILYNGRHTLTQKEEDGLYKTRLEINLQENA